MLYNICQYCITTVIYVSQKRLMQAGGVFRCPSGLSCNAYVFRVNKLLILLLQGQRKLDMNT